MKFIQGHNRTQIALFPVSLDESIDPDNEMRIIDLFVDSLSLKDFGFLMEFVENDSKAIGVQLYTYKKRNKQGKLRCGVNVAHIQPQENC